MKRSVILLFLVMSVGWVQIVDAQTMKDETRLSELEPEAYFDFWVGKWNLTWEDADGAVAKGTNHIEKVLDGKVIKENFEAQSGAYEGFVGKSYSVYNSNTGEWKQTWVDNQGGYLDFMGKFEGNKRIFIREGINQEGEPILQRMVFYDITEDSLTWDWEMSEDNGETWQLQWRINYERAD